MELVKQPRGGCRTINGAGLALGKPVIWQAGSLVCPAWRLGCALLLWGMGFM
jgi:hypothetical protein